MCVLLGNPQTCRRRLKGGSLILLWLWLSSNALHAQDLAQGISGPEGALIRWAMTQGGPSVIAILIAMSYRRDLLGVIKEQKDAIAVLRSELITQRKDDREVMNALLAMVEKSTAATERVTASVNALTVEVRRDES